MPDLAAPMGEKGLHTPRLPPPPQTQESRRSILGRWFDSWMRSLGMALVLFLIIRTFLLEAFQIPSGSMEHTLLAGDFLFVNKAGDGAQISGANGRLPGVRTPRHGDLIRFAHPQDPTNSHCKRVLRGAGVGVAMRRE